MTDLPRPLVENPVSSAGEPGADDPGQDEGPAEIRLQGVHFAYPGRPPVLRDLDLEVKAGERLGILGPSGSGKTTLLLHLNGLLEPQRGAVIVGGVKVAAPNLPLIRRWVGLVFQDPDDQLFTLTVGEDVAFGPRNLALPEEEVARRVTQSLAAVELTGFEPRHPQHLSYGERRRASLATVLAMKPRVLALDEPFAHLPPGLVAKLVALLRSQGSTLVVVSQAVFPLLALCQRWAILADGRIQAEGPVKEIAGDRELLARYGLDFSFYLEAFREVDP